MQLNSTTKGDRPVGVGRLEELAAAGLVELTGPATSPSTSGLILLLDPTSGRSETARRLAGAGDWSVLAVDSGQAERLGPAIEALAEATRYDPKQSFVTVTLEAIVLEAAHPLLLLRPTEKTVSTPLTAFQLLIWLENRLILDYVPVVLYTADALALAQARQDWDFARRSGRHRLTSFAASVERNPASQSDLALAQLLERITLGGAVESIEDEELPF